MAESPALIRLAVNLGFAIGPAIGGLVAARIGYNWLFWIDGLTCISAGLFLMVALRPKEAKAKAPAPQAPRYPPRGALFFLWNA